MDFDSLLKLMVHKNASDMFITVGAPPSLKINGKIVPVSKTALNIPQARQIITDLMTDNQRKEFEETHECNFAVARTGVGRFRASALLQRGNTALVLRKIETKIPSTDELHLPRVIKDVAMSKRGLVIFVGATGSGKSTSLAAMIGYRNRHGNGHIITIEDPIEFVHEHQNCIITQREVGIDTESFQIALKNTLRQAPDVILIGEVRTQETMNYAIAFAETGHLCLCTLHANNANQAMDRIINFFPEERRHQLLMDLSLNLRGIIAQQLIPTPDGKGRRVAVEVLLNTPLAADHIRKGEVEKLKDLMKRSTELGMQTFDQALFDLYKDGAITYEDALHHADSPNDLRLMIKLGNKGDASDLGMSLDGVSLEDENEDNVNPFGHQF